MAIPWIKMEVTTPEKPEVFMIASRLGMNPENVFAKCFKVWRWADAHVDRCNENVTPDESQELRESDASSVTSASPARNNLVTKDVIDLIAGHPGFADAMILAGWLQQGEEGLTFPNVDRHLGEGSKTRGLTARRMGKSRKKVTVELRESDADSVTSASHQRYQRREEKRREENTSSPTPSSETVTQDPPPETQAQNDPPAQDEESEPVNPRVGFNAAYHPHVFPVAKEILRAYRDSVTPAYVAGDWVRNEIVRVIVQGEATKETLYQCIENFRKHCEQHKIHRQYRRGPQVFFFDGVWRDFMSEEKERSIEDEVRRQVEAEWQETEAMLARQMGGAV